MYRPGCLDAIGLERAQNLLFTSSRCTSSLDARNRNAQGTVKRTTKLLPKNWNSKQPVRYLDCAAFHCPQRI